jgi:hypothetical protein
MQPSPEVGLSDREVVERFVARVVVRPNAVDMEASGTVISLPWSAPAFLSVKGVLHQPDLKPTLKPSWPRFSKP